MKVVVRWLLRPAVLIPLMLSAGLLVVLFTVADVRKVAAIVEDFDPRFLLVFALLMAAYFAIRAAQWHFLLRRLGIRAPLRSQVFAYALGELTKSLPIGNYFQNYLLSQSQGTAFSVSSVATTLILVTEVVVSLAGVVVLGLGPWTGWLRPLILLGGVGVIALAVLLYALRNVVRLPGALARRKGIAALLAELRRSREGLRALLRPGVLLVDVLLSAAYLTVAGIGLYCIVRGAGLGELSVAQALAVYFFSLAIGLLVPIPVDIGLIELSGAGALTALAVGRSAALSVMLLNRVLSIAVTSALGIGVALLLHREVARLASGPSDPAKAAQREPTPLRARHAKRADYGRAHRTPTATHPTPRIRRVPPSPDRRTPSRREAARAG
ncbi:MAG TPA: lysylphosphatidylglycerol synthase transmembrane domain-containing protein [Ktedonobacterales bacterium]